MSRQPTRVRLLLAAIAICGSSLAACSGASTRHAAAPARKPTTTVTASPVAGDSVYAHDGATDLSATTQDDRRLVYVPNSESNTVDVIDQTSMKVIDHFDVGRLPQHVTPAWDLQRLYVDNDQGNSLTPIDPRTGKPGQPIPVDDPYNLYFTPDGGHAVVVAERLHRLDFRDPKTWALIKSVPIAHTGADHADFSADGSTMFVSCEFSGWVVRVDVRSMTVTGEVHVGGQPIDVKLSPDGRSFYVANQQLAGVSVIDEATLAVKSFVHTGDGAHGMYPSRDATRLYVSNRKAGTVSVLDFNTGDVITTWHVGGTPDMGGVSADGGRLWLSGRYDGAVYVIDTTTGKRLARIPVGRGPHGLCVFPQPGRVSLGHTGNMR